MIRFCKVFVIITVLWAVIGGLAFVAGRMLGGLWFLLLAGAIFYVLWEERVI